MSTTFRPYAPDQSLLLPPDVREWLPEGHLAHHISDLVDDLDLTAFYAPYEGDGRRNAPYEPRMMVKVLLYAYATGVFSSRRVARRLEEDVRWSRSFGPFEGFVKVYSGCKTTPSSSVWYLIIDDDELWESCGLMSESAKRGGEPREGVRGRGRKRRGDWRTKHLRACLLCGRGMASWTTPDLSRLPRRPLDLPDVRSGGRRGPRAALRHRRGVAPPGQGLRRRLGAGAPSARCGRRRRPPRPRARRAGRVREARQRARWSTMLWRMTARASLETRRNGRAGIPRRGSPQWWVAA